MCIVLCIHKERCSSCSTNIRWPSGAAHVIPWGENIHTILEVWQYLPTLIYFRMPSCFRTFMVSGFFKTQKKMSGYLQGTTKNFRIFSGYKKKNVRTLSEHKNKFRGIYFTKKLYSSPPFPPFLIFFSPKKVLYRFIPLIGFSHFLPKKCLCEWIF